MIDRVKVLHHFGDILPSQYVGIVLKKLYLARQKQTTREQNSLSDTRKTQTMLNISKRTKTKPKLECGSMPNVMAAQANIGGALCESSLIQFLVPCRKVWLTSGAGVPCSDAATIGERKT